MQSRSPEEQGQAQFPPRRPLPKAADGPQLPFWARPQNSFTVEDSSRCEGNSESAPGSLKAQQGPRLRALLGGNQPGGEKGNYG